MQRGLGWVVDAMYFFLSRCFDRSFIEGSATVDIQAQRLVEFGELPRLPVLQRSDHSRPPGAQSRHFSARGIALIIFQKRASPCERHLFLCTIGDQLFVDKLPTIIGIYPQDRKGEERSCALNGCQNRLLTAIREEKTFRPPSGHIGERQRVHIASFDVHAAMGHQIRFQKAGLDLIPLLERADRNLLLQQRSRYRVGGK